MAKRQLTPYGLIIILCCAAQVAAQPGPGDPPRRGPGIVVSNMLLIQIEAVQKELGLNKEQLAAVEKLADKTGGPRGGPGQGPPGVRGRLQEDPPGGPRRQRQGNRPPRDNGPADGPPGGPPGEGPPGDGPPGEGPPRGPGRQRPTPGADQGRRPDRRPGNMAEVNQQLAEILDETQMQRLGQILLQTIGVGALRNPKITEKLGIDEEQAQAIGATQQAARQDMRKQMRDLFDASAGDFEGMRDKIMELRKEMQETVLDELSEEQRTKFAEMQGEAFELPPEALFRARGGGQRGGPPRRNTGRPERPEFED